MYLNDASVLFSPRKVIISQILLWQELVAWKADIFLRREPKRNALKALPRLELGFLDSESKVLTITPQNRNYWWLREKWLYLNHLLKCLKNISLDYKDYQHHACSPSKNTEYQLSMNINQAHIFFFKKAYYITNPIVKRQLVYFKMPFSWAENKHAKYSLRRNLN